MAREISEPNPWASDFPYHCVISCRRFNGWEWFDDVEQGTWTWDLLYNKYETMNNWLWIGFQKPEDLVRFKLTWL